MIEEESEPSFSWGDKSSSSSAEDVTGGNKARERVINVGTQDEEEEEEEERRRRTNGEDDFFDDFNKDEEEKRNVASDEDQENEEEEEEEEEEEGGGEEAVNAKTISKNAFFQSGLDYLKNKKVDDFQNDDVDEDVVEVSSGSDDDGGSESEEDDEDDDDEDEDDDDSIENDDDEFEIRDDDLNTTTTTTTTTTTNNNNKRARPVSMADDDDFEMIDDDDDDERTNNLPTTARPRIRSLPSSSPIAGFMNNNATTIIKDLPKWRTLLPHYIPVSELLFGSRVNGETVFVDYKAQFNSDIKKKQVPMTVAERTAYEENDVFGTGKTNNSNNNKSAYWITSNSGRKTYVTKEGKKLTGTKAFEQYTKDQRKWAL